MQALRRLSLRSFLQQLKLRMPALRTQTEIMCRVGAQAMQVLQAWLGAHAMQAMRHCVSCHQQRRHQLLRAAPAARGGTSCSSSEGSPAARGASLDLFGRLLFSVGPQLLRLFILSPVQVSVCTSAQLRAEFQHTPRLQSFLKGDLLPLPLSGSVEDQRVVSDLVLEQNLPWLDADILYSWGSGAGYRS